MKVWFVNLEDESEVCSTLEKAIDAVKASVGVWASDVKIEDVYNSGERVIVFYSCAMGKRRVLDSVRITSFELDGGPNC